MSKGDLFDTHEEVFEYIAKSSFHGNLGLFIGAGLPMAVLNTDVKTALTWKELILKCSKELDIDFEKINTDGLSYPEIATQICKTYSKHKKITYNEAVKKLKELISTFTSWYPVSEVRNEYKKYFDRLSPSWIITTNYDLVIESILTGKGYSLSPDDQLIAPKGFVPIYHLHGIRTNPDSIVITQEDYISLFRPNQYRQQKLPLTIKESVTLLIGYNLNDFNVLTAVDWSKNVFAEQKTNYPQNIIQFYFTSSPSSKPYKDINDIIIVEFDDLSNFLEKLTKFIREEKKKLKETQKELKSLNEFFKTDLYIDFVDSEAIRKSTLEMLRKNEGYLISGFLELFSKSIDLTWERAKPNGAFYAYNENLIILLDVIENINIKAMPPALIEAVAYNLNRVANYIGSTIGYSLEANRTWKKRKGNIPDETQKELLNIAKVKGYYEMKGLFS